MTGQIRECDLPDENVLTYFIRPLISGVSWGDEADDQQQVGMPGEGECRVSSVSLCHLQYRFFWSPSRFEASHPGGVCLEGQLAGGHGCQMSKPRDALMLYAVVGWCCCV